MERFILVPKDLNNENWRYSRHKKRAIASGKDERQAREKAAAQLLEIIDDPQKDFEASPWLDKNLVECRLMRDCGNGDSEVVFIEP